MTRKCNPQATPFSPRAPWPLAHYPFFCVFHATCFQHQIGEPCASVGEGEVYWVFAKPGSVGVHEWAPIARRPATAEVLLPSSAIRGGSCHVLCQVTNIHPEPLCCSLFPTWYTAWFPVGSLLTWWLRPIPVCPPQGFPTPPSSPPSSSRSRRPPASARL